MKTTLIIVARELLQDARNHLDIYLQQQIDNRTSHYLPPDHLRGDDKSYERWKYYQETTDPAVYMLIKKIDAVLNGGKP